MMSAYSRHDPEAATLIGVRNRAVGAHVPVDVLEVRSILVTELVELLCERCGVKAAISSCPWASFPISHFQ